MSTMFPAMKDVETLPIGSKERLRTLEIDRDHFKKKAFEIAQRYHELLFQVGNKTPGESRHDTALRYIKAAEESGGEDQISRKRLIPAYTEDL